MAEAFRAAQLILSSYPQSINAANAECYAAQVVALLSTYPPEVVAELAKPVTGIVGKLKWLPAVAELKEAADRIMRIPLRMVEDRDAELKQIAERGKPASFSPAKPKQIETWQRLKANIGAKP